MNNLLVNAQPDKWQGRNDGDATDLLRWHQIVTCKPLDELPPNTFHLPPSTFHPQEASNIQHQATFNPPPSTFNLLLGFKCDEGVRRNKGRTGAKAAPDVLRSVCANFPAHNRSKGSLIDAGNVVCDDENLEQAQTALAETVAHLLQLGYRPMVLGGGHEVAYGHFSGIRKAFPNKKIGIINFDAHFDMREPDPVVGASSGTGFWQIAQEETDFHYLVLGIQPNSNTQRLFNTAQQHGVQYVLGEDFYYENLPQIVQSINNFAAQVDVLYLTICMDVFAAPYAPGVSALAYNGIAPDKTFKAALRCIIASPKLVSVDIAELNPSLDIDNRTARLAASFIFEIVNAGRMFKSSIE